MTEDRLSAIRQELKDFVAERDWAQYHDPKNLAMAVASEAGELLAGYRWVSQDRSDVWSSDASNRERVKEEVADVGIALLLFCDRVGIDLVDAIRRKIEINRLNYPIDKSKGRSGRPD